MKRRKFFKLASAGAASITLGTACRRAGDNTGGPASGTGVNNIIPDYRATIKTSFSKSDTRSPNDKVILALIGAGGFGTYLILEAVKAGGNILIKYVCDVDDTRGGRAIYELEKIQGFKPISVRDMRRVFDDSEVDGVFIATPEHWHALATIWACQAGKDVYVEKTVSHNIFEGQQMIKAAMKYERIVQCGTQNRSSEYALTAREYIKNGGLGKIGAVHVRHLVTGPIPFQEREDTPAPDTIDWDMWLGPAPQVPYSVTRNKSWGFYWDYGGGVTSGDAIHQVDLARLVLDDPGFPKSVYCCGGRYFFDDNRDAPDYQMVTFDYDKFVLTLDAGSCTPYMQKTPPQIRLGDTFPQWMQNSTRVLILGTEKMMYLGRMGGGWQVFDMDEQLVAEESGYFPLQAHILDFIDCIRTRKQPRGNIVQGHNSSVLIHLANIAYRSGNKQLLFSPDYETITNDQQAVALARGSYRPGYEVAASV